jgi:hypothetical protein
MKVPLEVERLPLQGHDGLFEVLGQLTDARARRGRRYALQAVLAIAACAVLTGARSLEAIAEWAADQTRDTLKRLGSRYGHAPSESTFRRVFRGLDVAAFDRTLGAWTQRHGLGTGTAPFAGQGLGMDGKAVRGSATADDPAVHLVGLVTHDTGLVVGQHRVPDKTNEITCVEPLLAPLDLTGAVVTGDALLAQRALAAYVVEQKHADYFFTVKANQPSLCDDIATLHLEATPPGA